MKGIFCLLSAGIVLTGCTKTLDVTTSPEKPTFLFPAAAQLETTYNFEIGNYYNYGGLEYSDTLEVLRDGLGSLVTMDTPDSIKQFTLTGLRSSTTYYYRSFIIKNNEAYYGQERSFTTPDAVGMTTEVSDITSSGAIISVKNDTTVNYSVKFTGVQYALSAEGVASGTKQKGLYSTGKVTLTDLKPQTNYYYRPFAYVYYDPIKIYTFEYGDITAFTTTE